MKSAGTAAHLCGCPVNWVESTAISAHPSASPNRIAPVTPLSIAGMNGATASSSAARTPVTSDPAVIQPMRPFGKGSVAPDDPGLWAEGSWGWLSLGAQFNALLATQGQLPVLEARDASSTVRFPGVGGRFSVLLRAAAPQCAGLERVLALGGR